MTAILILVGIAVAIVGTIVLVTVPFKHVEAVARDFSWRRSVHIGQRVWVQKRSKRQPRKSIDARNVEAHNADDPNKLHYTYEKRVWRDMRTVPAAGLSQATVRDPQYILAKDEEVRRTSESYEARFVSEMGSPTRRRCGLPDGNRCRQAQSINWAATRSGAYGRSSLQRLQLTSAR